MISIHGQRNWGFTTALAMFLEGSCGATTVSGILLGNLPMVILGVALGMAAGLILLLELGNPKNAIWLLAGIRHAWISRGTLLLLLVIVFGLAYALVGLPTVGAPPVLSVVAGVTAGIAGLLLTLYPGFLLASFKPIPLWHSALSPILSFGISALGGFGVTLVMSPLVTVNAVQMTIPAVSGAVVFQAVAWWAFIDTALKGSVTESHGARVLLGLPVFSAGAIAVGLALPGVIMVLAWAAGVTSLPLYVVAGVCLLAGSLSARYALLRAGVRLRWQPA